ncbi:MAG TPA: 2Fe-2S iron-sulfur cluster binding domain-containing protein, partial [Candidatus Eisenbacteria bacterium]|nr:2Fe-2S iron-sulfur cluster binding domain-containing protein [Candidatus Eisenbacteria bacterium]
MMAAGKIDITIDGKKVSVVKGAYLLGVLRDNGVQVPTLCHHKDLTPQGLCRFCVVEIEEAGRRRLVTSCNYPVRKEISVHTASDRVKEHRKRLAEIYLGRWPNVPVIKSLAKLCGASDAEKYR